MQNTTTTTKAVATSTKAVAVQSGPTKSELRTLGNIAAGKAVAAFYAGKSLPFKSASQRLSPLNPNNAKKPSARQAGALAACLIYAGSNVSKTGIFTRDGFNVPATLANKKAKSTDTMPAQLESGVLGNMLGTAIKQHADGVRFVMQFDAIEKQYLPMLPQAVRSDAFAALKAIRAA